MKVSLRRKSTIESDCWYWRNTLNKSGVSESREKATGFLVTIEALLIKSSE